MNIYLYTDEEGVAGVDWWDHRTSTHPFDIARCQRARELLMGEVNAAAEGAFAAGAQHVLAVEGHNTSFVYELADPRLEIVTGRGYPEWIPEIDSGFTAAFVIGAHAMYGTPGATLAHAFNYEQQRQWNLCGRKVGEFGAFAAICGVHGVPVIMGSGDDKFCAEARALLPGIETAQVKKGIGLHCARHLSTKCAREKIRETAQRAVAKLAKSKPEIYRPSGPPYVFRLKMNEQQNPILRSGVELRAISDTEIELRGDDLLAVIGSGASY